jgi:hypothetical protein
MTDRAFLNDVFVDLFEGTDAERDIHQFVQTTARRPAEDEVNGRDFTIEVSRWLDQVLVTPTPSKRPGKRPRRLWEERARRA